MPTIKRGWAGSSRIRVFLWGTLTIGWISTGFENKVLGQGEPPAEAKRTVLWMEDFESNPSLDRVFPDRSGPHRVVEDKDLAYQGTRCLEVLFPKGKDGGWLSRYFTPGLKSGTVRLSARIRLEPGWGGITRIAGLKGSPDTNLQASNGIAGVRPDLGKNGIKDEVDPFFAATVELSHLGADDGQLRFYDQWVDQGGVPPGNGFAVHGSGGGFGKATYTPKEGVRLTLGKWHLIETEIRLNDVGRANGWHRFYLDGILLGDFPHLTWRTTEAVRFTQVQLDMHSGGGAPRDQRVYWDSLVLTHTPP